ncbi:hypothetical protein [Sphingomonas abietis]|uniref:Uncharacterized protein n=1 Tax=Sphingomonas abietis TaxID=3012344 RepID=A0ABY7NHG4_9SPHN|nr:hypothetical protein [Sphingomonas abietis]WBO20980.1 hypothetical protein PBT88_12265 [Sphingomonas abietis]
MPDGLGQNSMEERLARARFEQADSRASQPDYEREIRWEVAKSLYIEDARAVLAVGVLMCLTVLGLVMAFYGWIA